MARLINGETHLLIHNKPAAAISFKDKVVGQHGGTAWMSEVRSRKKRVYPNEPARADVSSFQAATLWYTRVIARSQATDMAICAIFAPIGPICGTSVNAVA